LRTIRTPRALFPSCVESAVFKCRYCRAHRRSQRGIAWGRQNKSGSRLRRSMRFNLEQVIREEKIGETFDFAPGKIHSEPSNLGRIVVVSPNAEAVSGRFSGNPSASVMTAPLRSSTVPAEAETIRHCVRVFRRGMPSRIFLPRDHATALSLQDCKMPLFMSLIRAIRVRCFRNSFSSMALTL